MTDKDPIAAFEAEAVAQAAAYQEDPGVRGASAAWMDHAFRKRYMYNFAWAGRPIIQLPADMVALQEVIWSVKPDLIVETGIAHGGSLILSASMLALLELEEAEAKGESVNPRDPKRKVLGVDIDIRAHNRAAIEAHPMARRIDMIQGSSLAEEVLEKVYDYAKPFHRVLVTLDSNHTHEHVLAELEGYAPLTSAGSYCVVFDTVVEDLNDDMFPDRPWARGDNPKTAIAVYQDILNGEGRTAKDGTSLKLELDRTIDDKLLLSAAPGGWLKRV